LRFKKEKKETDIIGDLCSFPRISSPGLNATIYPPHLTLCMTDGLNMVMLVLDTK